MQRLKRWTKRVGKGVVLLALVLTLASITFNLATASDSEAVSSLYRGPLTTVDGRRIAYRHWGRAGSPIILLGGFAVPSFVWDKVGPSLAPQHRVYALDLPPFGYSQRKGPYTLRSWVNLVRDFDNRFKLNRPVIVGHSLAAAVAVGMTLWHPANTRGILLLDGDALSERGAPSWLPSLLVGPWFTSAYRIVTGSDWIVRRVLKGALGSHRPSLDHDDIEPWKRPFHVEGTLDAFRAMARYGIQGFHLSDLRAVREPTALVWGEDDTVDAVSAGRRSARALETTFTLIPRAGHLSMVSSPAAVARAIERFAASGEAGR